MGSGLSSFSGDGPTRRIDATKTLAEAPMPNAEEELANIADWEESNPRAAWRRTTCWFRMHPRPPSLPKQSPIRAMTRTPTQMPRTLTSIRWRTTRKGRTPA